MTTCAAVRNQYIPSLGVGGIGGTTKAVTKKITTALEHKDFACLASEYQSYSDHLSISFPTDNVITCYSGIHATEYVFLASWGIQLHLTPK